MKMFARILRVLGDALDFIADILDIAADWFAEDDEEEEEDDEEE